MENLRRTLHVVLALAAVTLFALPVTLAALAGWFSSERVTPISIEGWALLAVFYVVWGLALVIGLVWSLDRLGARWHAYDRSPPTRRQRRRLRAALQLEETLQQRDLSRLRRKERR